ncbi:MAG: IS66 family transposase, partial [Verrucomicrobiae bacterium]|nr:IS66 family transposase [Verrucomicrobiae bacterium]
MVTMKATDVPDLSKLSPDEKDALIIDLLGRVRESAAGTEAKIEQLTAQVEQLEEMLTQRDQRIRQLERENQTLVRRLYGPKSDRPGDDAQLLLDGIIALEHPGEEAGNQDGDGNASDASDEAADSKPKEKEKKRKREKEKKKKKSKKSKKSTGRKLLPEALERRIEEVDLPEDEKIDAETGLPMIFLGWETRERLVEEPANLYVHVLKRAKYAYPQQATAEVAEQQDGQQQPDNQEQSTIILRPGVITAPEPPRHGNPIDRCKADVSVLAFIIVAKFCYHQPLYRLQERYWRLGRVWLARSTLCGWMSGCALALEAIYKRMKELLLGSKYIGLDDTTVKMLDPGAGKAASTRFWSYVGLLESTPYNLYQFTLSREKTAPLEFLGDYQGHLQGDAYAGNPGMGKAHPGIIPVACWDHARRYFTDASDEHPSASAEALAYIKRLYKIERSLKEASVEERKLERQSKAVPILLEFKTWLEGNQEQHLNKSGLRSAINYSLNQWQALNEYTSDGN